MQIKPLFQLYISGLLSPAPASRRYRQFGWHHFNFQLQSILQTCFLTLIIIHVRLHHLCKADLVDLKSSGVDFNRPVVVGLLQPMVLVPY